MQAARGANAVFGDETSVQIAAQLYAHKVELLRGRAQTVGVGSIYEGKQLIELSPEELNVWVRDVLAPAESEAKEAQEF